MSITKRIFMLFFIIALVINLQFSGSLNSQMEKVTSLEQITDNMFFPSAFANIDCIELSGCKSDNYYCVDPLDAVGYPQCYIQCSGGVFHFCAIQ
jgi:hypothetical protein